MSTPRLRRWHMLGALFVLTTLVLGCGVGGVAATITPRWACPSPLPKPYGPSGPVKSVKQHCDTDPATGVTTCHDERVYYEEWEQEYGTLGGPPFPSPTPYGFSRRSFIFGQRIEVAPLHVTVTATAGALISGALTDWGSGPKPVSVPSAPPGTDRVEQIALNQVGKTYIWGAKGPETFDCSGLMTWSYGQIGIPIPQGTAGQWPQMRPVDASQLKPGDLIFFAIDGGAIDHVGMMVGDLNGDGKWDMVHAASPKLGVRIDYDVLGSRYYAARVRGFRTAR